MLKIIFEDECLLVVDKPAGLVVTTSETNKEKTLEDILKEEYNIPVERSGIVHRLDKDTSGLLLVGKTEKCQKLLQAQFKERKVKKEYLSLVHGFVKEKGRVEVPIGRNLKNREKFMADGNLPDAKEAVTEYQPQGNFQFSIFNFQKIFHDLNKIQLRKLERQRYGEFTLVKAQPLTGRTHQIRVHLKYIGHPVVGDDKYGGRKMARLDRRWILRQFLHAARLELNHPLTGKRVVFESPLPEDLKAALEVLEEVK